MCFHNLNRFITPSAETSRFFLPRNFSDDCTIVLVIMMQVLCGMEVKPHGAEPFRRMEFLSSKCAGRQTRIPGVPMETGFDACDFVVYHFQLTAVQEANLPTKANVRSACMPRSMRAIWTSDCSVASNYGNLSSIVLGMSNGQEKSISWNAYPFAFRRFAFTDLVQCSNSFKHSNDADMRPKSRFKVLVLALQADPLVSACPS